MINRHAQQGYTILELGFLLYAACWIIGIIGWIANIVALCHMAMPVDIDHASIMFILRIIGIPFAPLGAVLGLFF